MTTQIQEYSQTEAALAMLRERYAGAQFPVETPEGMKEAKAARSELRKYRTDLERVRKEIKGPALERCRLIDAEAKRITEELRALEDPIAEQIEAEERRQEEERQERIRQEQERVEAIQRRIDDIRHAVEPIAWDTPSTEIATTIALVEEIAIDDSFAEFIEQARDAKDATLARLRELESQAKAREEDEARRKAEQAELERRRADEERKRAIRERIDRLRVDPESIEWHGCSSEQIAAHLSAVKHTVIDESFGEFQQDARDAKELAITRLEKLHAAAVDREQEEARRRAELEAQEQRLAAERKRQAVRDQISIILALPAQCPGLTSAEIERVLARAESFIIPEIDDAGLRLEAEEAKVNSLNAIRLALDGRRKYEAEQADLARQKAAQEQREREEAERKRQAEEAARKARYPGDDAIVASVMSTFGVTAEIAEKWLQRYAENVKRSAAA